jgi:excinuclease UvrABC nuclease subunit
VKNYLYRHFDGSNRLLYVGVSLSAFQRLGQHRNHAHWFEQIKRVEMEQFATRQEALDAERVAIERERPLFNIQHSEQHALARKAAKTQRAKVIREKPNPTADKVVRDQREIEQTFWQWRTARRRLGQ